MLLSFQAPISGNDSKAKRKSDKNFFLQFVSGSVSYSEAKEERKKTVSHTRTEKKKKREGMTKGLEDLKRKNSTAGACKKKKKNSQLSLHIGNKKEKEKLLVDSKTLPKIR